MLGVEVGRVLLPGNLADLELPMSDPLLDPQTRVLQVTELAKTLPAADPDHCGTIGPQPQRQLVVDVTVQRFHPMAGAGPVDCAIKLGPTRAHCNSRLRRAPTLQQVRPHHDASACRRST